MTFWQIDQLVKSETLGKRFVTRAVCSSRERGERLLLKMGWPDGTLHSVWNVGDYTLTQIDVFMKRWRWDEQS